LLRLISSWNVCESPFVRLKVLYHDNCFDGATSAALFSQFYREKVRKDADIVLLGMTHKLGDAFPPGVFDAEENACVDFRYSSSPGLTWWFDHHESAFMSPDDEAHFRADQSGRKFYDPKARSCSKFLAETTAAKFGWDTRPYAELIRWADIIDGAQFPDAKTAVELKEPALQLMTWVEHNHDVRLKERFIAELIKKPLGAIAASDYVQKPLAPLLEQHQRAIDIVKQHAKQNDGVVEYDISDTDIEAMNKFIIYYLFPDCRYSVGVSRSRTRTKVSVGSNPWAKVPRTHNLSTICSRYGGGGHPVVGAVSMPPTELAEARRIAHEIAAELRSG
jgi:hypothetical protein